MMSMRVRGLLAVAAFVCVAGVLSYRTSTKLDTAGRLTGTPDAAQWGLADFRDNFYYPVVALLAGQNPYDRGAYMSTYPVVNGFPLYLPLTLIVYLPFGLLDLAVAQLTYYMATIVLTVLLAIVTLRLCALTRTFAAVFALDTLMLCSRPGHWNLVLGNCAVLSSLGLYVALLYARKRPWVAGLGLALATFKPTFGLPAAALMLARRDTQAVAIGLSAAALLSIPVVAVITYHQPGGIAGFAGSILGNYAEWQALPVVNATAGPFRVDLVALVARLTGRVPGPAAALLLTMLVLALAAVAVRRASQVADAAGTRTLQAGLVCVSVLVCTYHQAYDLLLLALPLTALATGTWAPAATARPRLRWLLLVLLALPAANYLASGTAIAALRITGGWRLAVTSFNSMALVAALGLYAAVCWLQQPPRDSRGGRGIPPALTGQQPGRRSLPWRGEDGHTTRT